MKRTALVLIFAIAFLFAIRPNAGARTFDFNIYMDTDNNSATGCAVVTDDGVLGGIEKILTTTADMGSFSGTITGVVLKTCDLNSGTFGPAVAVDAGGWAVGIGAGADGTDVVETYVIIEDPLSGQIFRLAASAAEVGIQGGTDTLLLTNGNSGGPILLDRAQPPIPTLGQFGALLLMLLLAVSAMIYFRKFGKNKASMLVVILILTAAVGIAWAVCSSDGDISDWAGINPVAIDPQNDTTDAPDIRYLFAKTDGNQTCFRIDAYIPKNTPPVLDLDGTADDPDGDIDFETNFIAGSGSTAIVDALNLLLTDEQGENIAWAAVTLVNRPDGTSEKLTAAAAGSITAMYDDTAGVLTLTGPDTPANFQTALRSVTYDNTDSDLDTTDRQIDFVVNDGYDNSQTATTVLHMIGKNHAPTFDKGPDPTVDEDAGAQTVANWAQNIDDGDPEPNQTLTFQVTANTNPGLFSSGPAVDGTSGDLTFTPAADANGFADITLVLKDDGGTANSGADTSASQTFRITVTPVNDGVTANNDPTGFATDEDTVLNSGNVLENDAAPDGGLVAVAASLTSTKGAAVNMNADGTFSYDPTGSSTLQALANGESTTDTFTYTARDIDSDTDTAIVTITVSGKTELVNAMDDSGFSTDEDTPLTNTGNLFSNDIAPDGGLTFPTTSLTSTLGASVTLNPDGSFNYDPTGSASLQTMSSGSVNDTFTYTAIDSDGDTDTATVTVIVAKLNDGVTANNDPTGFATDEDTVLNSGNVLDNDTAPDGGLAAVAASLTSTKGAAVTINTNGTFSYDPAGSSTLQALANGQSTTDTFMYTARDTDSDTNSATVTITVNGRNDTVNAENDSGFSTDEDTPLTNTGNLFSNDTAPDGGKAFQTTSLTSTQGAAVTLNVDGSFDYDPTGSTSLQALASGTVNDTFTYTVGDTDGDTDTATVTVVVSGVNGVPTAGADAYQTAGNTKLAAGGASPGSLAYVENATDVLSNDVDGEENSALSITGLQGTSGTPPLTGTSDLGGAVTLNADGSFTYVPPSGIKNKVDNTGTGGSDERDKFTYAISDGADTATGTVYIEIIDALVWYVHNDPAGEPLNTAGGDGTSSDPFDKLGDGAGDSTSDDPEDASSENDVIFVFEGDGTSAGQDSGISLKNGQKLFGHAATTLTIGSVTIQTPNPPSSTMSPASDRPVIDNTSGNGVMVDAATGERTGIEIRGLDISGTDNAIDISSGASNMVGVVISDNFINSAGAEGIDMNPDGDGDFTVSVDGNKFSTASAAGNALDLTTTGTSLNRIQLALADNSNIHSSGGSAVFVDASTMGMGGVAYITDLTGNTISSETAGDGFNLKGVIFDSDPVTGDFDNIHVATLTIGTAGVPIGQAGIRLAGVSGDLSFGDLDIVSNSLGFEASGTGLFVDGSPDTGFKLTLSGTNNIDTRGGPALTMESLTGNLDFGQILSDASASHGVRLTNMEGQFNAGSTSLIKGTNTSAFEVDGGTATVTYQGDIGSTAGKSVIVKNRTGAGAGDVTFSGDVGTSVIPTCGGILVSNNSVGTFSFQGGIYLSTDSEDAVKLDSNTGAAIDFTGDLEITTGTGDGFKANGGGTIGVDSSGNTTQIMSTGGRALVLDSIGIAGGGITFDSVNATNIPAGQSGVDVNLLANSETLTITSATISTTTTSGGAPGINIRSSAGDFVFNSVNIDNTHGHGINLGSLSGTVTIGGGTIDGTGGDGIHGENSNLAVSNLTLGENSPITLDGIDLAAATGDIETSFSNVGITAGGDAIKIASSGGHHTTISAFLNIGVTVNGTGGGIKLQGALFDADPDTGAIDQVMGGNANIGTTIARISGDGLQLNDPSGDLAFGTLNIANTGGTGLFVDTKTAGTTFNLVSAGGAIDTEAGPALDLDPPVMNMLTTKLVFNTVKSNNSTGAGIVLDRVSPSDANPALTVGTLDIDNPAAEGVLIKNSSGPITITGGDITDAAGTSATFRIGDGSSSSGGDGDVSYGGTINNNSSSGRCVHIDHRTGGSATFSGAVSDSGMGVELDTNTGSTINFSGGLTLDTTNNDAFTATGGGTLNVTGTNAVTTTTGVGVKIENTAIGASGVTFAGINVDGALNGIVLNTTGTNGFTVGPTSGAFGAGGTIKNTTGDAVVLNDTDNVTIRRMIIGDASVTPGSGITATLNIQGDIIQATDVNGLTLDTIKATRSRDFGILGERVNTMSINDSQFLDIGNDDSDVGARPRDVFSFIGSDGLAASNLLTGTVTITDTIIRDFRKRAIFVRQNSGTLNITFTDCTIKGNSATGEDGLHFYSQGSAAINATVNKDNGTCLFQDIRGQGVRGVAQNTGSKVDIDVRDCTFIGNVVSGGGVNVISSGGGDATFDIVGNTFTDLWLTDLFDVTGSGTISGNFVNNNSSDSGALPGDALELRCDGDGSGNPTFTMNIDGNTFDGHDDVFEAVNRNGGGTMHLTIKNNTVGQTDAPDDDVFVITGGISTGSATGVTNVLLEDNQIFSGGDLGFDLRTRQDTSMNATVVNNRITVPDDSIRMRQQSTSGTSCLDVRGNDNGSGGQPVGDINIEQSAGTFNVTQSAANVASFNNGATVVTAGSINYGGTSCTVPTLPPAP